MTCVEIGLINVNHCNPDENTPNFTVGRFVTVGRFACKVLESGVECTITATGKGFPITPESVTGVG